MPRGTTYPHQSSREVVVKQWGSWNQVHGGHSGIFLSCIVGSGPVRRSLAIQTGRRIEASAGVPAAPLGTWLFRLGGFG